MKLLGRKNDDSDGAAEVPPPADPVPAGAGGTTAPKGRPTPKRADKRRGPVAPAPLTAAEARQRRKEMRRTMTKEERREQKARERAVLEQRRERMLAGDESALLPRDRGPVRRYVRDIVDGRRNLLGLFMPSAIFLIFVMLGLPVAVQAYISPFMLLFTIAMITDAVLLSRKVNKAVDAKFPETAETHFKLDLYAVSRASQIRRMRIPRPQVPAGAKVA